MASGILAAIARPSGRERLGHLLGLRALPLGGAMAFLQEVPCIIQTAVFMVLTYLFSFYAVSV